MNKEKILKFLDNIRFLAIANVLFWVPITFAWFKENMHVFDLNKQVVFRGLVAILAITVLAISLIKKEFKFNFSKIWFIFLAIIFLLTANIFYSIDSWRSFIGSWDRQQGIYSLFFYFLFFFLLVISIKGKEEIRKLINWLASSAVIVSIYGIMQYYGHDIMVWARPEGRIFSSIGQPNFLAHWLLLIMPLTIYGFWVNKGWQKYLMLVSFCLQLFTFYATWSRGGYIGFIFAILVALFFFLADNRKKLKFFLFGVSLVLMLFFSLFWQYENVKNSKILFSNPVIGKFITIFNTSDSTQALRLKYWGAAMAGFNESGLDRKIFGYGKEIQENILIKHYEADWGTLEELNSFPDRAHNIFFDCLLEFGLAGLIIFGSFLASLFLLAFKRIKEVGKEEKYLIIAILASIGGYIGAGMLSFPMTTIYVYYYFSLACLFALVRPNYKTIKIEISKFLSYFLLFSVSLFFVFLWWFFDVRSLVADHYFIKAKTAEVENNFRGMFDYIDATVAWYPEQNFYKEQYIAMYINASQGVSSKESMKQAESNAILMAETFTSGAKTRYKTLNQLAHLYSYFGWQENNQEYIKQADEYYNKIFALNQYITITYQDYGRSLMWLNEYDEAIKVFRRGLAITPSEMEKKNNPGSHWPTILKQRHYFYSLICDCYFAKKDWPNALKNCLKAEELNNIIPRNLKEIADIYGILKNTKKQEEYLRKAQENDLANYLRYTDLAQFYYQEKDSKNAKKYIEMAKEIAPNERIVQALNKQIYKK